MGNRQRACNLTRRTIVDLLLGIEGINAPVRANDIAENSREITIAGHEFGDTVARFYLREDNGRSRNSMNCWSAWQE